MTSSSQSLLDRFERILGSSMLSWICVSILLTQMKLWVAILLLAPLVNYLTKLDEIHAALRARAQEQSA
jgi:hypothetical protein